ncbi:MAG TPA: aldo/keto reductase [Alphaproteobacteria bacterium]|nr:aldo/keto reductase [Alphaproteobacteria bacterium]
MEYRRLGKTGLEASVIGIGSWQLSGPLTVDGRPDGFADIGEAAAVDLIRALGERGVNFIDTAPIYGDGVGETRIGKAIRGQRDRWLVSTKFGMTLDGAGRRRLDLSPAAVRRNIEDSLRRLATDHVDLYLFHSDPAPAEIAPCLELLGRLKAEGKIRAAGVSTDSTETLSALIAAGGIDACLLTHSLYREPQAQFDLAMQAGLGILKRGVLEFGLLSGNYFRARASYGRDDIRRTTIDHLDSRRFAAFRALVPPGASMPAFAVRYVLDRPDTHVIIYGGKSLDQYQAAFDAVAMTPLAPAMIERVAETRRRLARSLLVPRALRKMKRVLRLA